MSSVIARRIAASPARSAGETWTVIVDLLAPASSSTARAELQNVAGVVCSAISAEATRDDPIVVQGCGPRVRIYCLFGDDAVVGDDVNEDALAKTPTEGDWSLSVPCPAHDLKWCQSALASISSRVTARTMGEDAPERTSRARAEDRLAINPEEFLRP